MLTVSYSQLTEFANCRRRWELRWREGWLPPEDPEPLVLGRAVHAGLAARVGGEDPELATIEAITEASLPPEQKRWISAKALPLVEHASVPKGEVLAIEHRFQVPFSIGQIWLDRLEVGEIRFQLHGVFDLILRDENAILIFDWKTVSQIPNCDRMRELDDQLALYSSAAAKLWPKTDIRVMWGALRVPLKPRKSETPVQFRRRWEKELERNPERYIQFFPIVMTPQRVNSAIFRAAILAEEIQAGKIYRNPEACRAWPCPYEPICSDSSRAEALGFRKLERRHNGDSA